MRRNLGKTEHLVLSIYHEICAFRDVSEKFFSLALAYVTYLLTTLTLPYWRLRQWESFEFDIQSKNSLIVCKGEVFVQNGNKINQFPQLMVITWVFSKLGCVQMGLLSVNQSKTPTLVNSTTSNAGCV